MHYAVMVTFTLENATREDAHKHLRNWLDANCHETESDYRPDDPDADEDGYMIVADAGAIDGDWCLIGGRWSGRLSPVYNNERWQAEQARILDHYAKETNDPFASMGGYSDETCRRAKPELDTLWKELGGEYTAERDQYGRGVYMDDVAYIDQRMYDDYLMLFIRKNESHRRSKERGDEWSDPPPWVDVDGLTDPDEEALIGKKWLAIVDVHT